MKRILITVVFFFLGSLSFVRAQMNVGSSSAPDPSSILQLSSSNQGLRLPNVSLTSTTTFGLVGSASAATVGMQVYNTNAGITSTNTTYPACSGGKGIYTWDGIGWKLSAANTPTLEVHANFTSITRGISGRTTALTSNNATVGTNINTIPNAVFTASTGNILLPAGTYLMTIAYSLSANAASGTGANPAVHGFLFDFPSDAGLNGTTSRFEVAQPANNSSTNNTIGLGYSYLSILNAARNFNFGIGWGANNININAATIAYKGTASICIIKIH